MIGVDIIEIDRVAKAASKDSFLTGTYTQGELAYYRQTGKRSETLAGIFAAKEAVAKASGKGLMAGYKLTDIEVEHTESGQPYIILHGGAKDIFGGKILDISISHNKTMAIAFCVVR